MKFSNQVTNKDLSQKIKELGVKQDSLWWWNEMLKECACSDGCGIHKDISANNELEWILSLRPQECGYSAFTVAELGEMLPDLHKTIKTGKRWTAYCLRLSKEFQADTEANARAKMLVYLLENKLMEIPK